MHVHCPIVVIQEFHALHTTYSIRGMLSTSFLPWLNSNRALGYRGRAFHLLVELSRRAIRNQPQELL